MDGQSDRSNEPLKSFDFNKRNDRDSVDTLELLKESTETHDDEEDANNFQDDKTLTNRSNKSTFEDNIKPQEKMEERESRNSLEMSRNSSISSSSIASSMNIESQMNPLPIDSVPFNSNQNSSNYYNHKDNDDDDVETSDLMHLEPKLRDAWIKMRKLDKKLAKLSKKEKQVKKETLALIEKNRAELELLKYTSLHKESAVEIANTARFLSLAYCDIDDEMEKDYPIDSEPATPVFKTQLPDIDENESLVDEAEYIENKRTSIKKEKTNADNSPKKFAPASSSSVSSNNKSKNQNSNTSSKKNATSNSKEQTNQSGKDFIKRNIQLAQDDAGALAMTEDEKHRLNELMIDMDEHDANKNRLAINEESEDNETVVVEYNPFAVTLTQGQGFTPDEAELERLRHIETSLSKRTVSRLTTSNGRLSGGFSDSMQKFSSVGSIASNNNHIIESEFYRGLDAEKKQIKLNDEFDENEFGDKFIREARISREKELRLKFIDQQLEKIRNNNVTESNPSQSDNISDFNSDSMSNSTVSLISEDTIKQLIEDYSYENPKYVPLGRNQKLDTLREENDTDSQNTLSNIEMETREMENFYNAPTLNDNTIKTLLDQARNEGIFVTANSNREDDSTERSFYQEALEIVNKRKIEFELARANLEREQVVPEGRQEENQQKEDTESRNIEFEHSSNKTDFSKLKKLEDYHIDVDELNEDLMFKSKMEDSNLLSKRINSSRSDKFDDTHETNDNLAKFEFQNDEKLTKLPPLFNKNLEDFANENSNGNEDGRFSSMSNSSTTVLPKINDRYLPKEK